MAATVLTKAKSQGRSLRWDRESCTLTLTVERQGRSRPEVSSYRVAEIDSDFGRGFSLVKLGAGGEPVETYAANVGVGCQSCDCADFLARQRECKHLAALAKLIERGHIR